MTEPTPSQVEAACKAFYEDPEGWTDWSKMAYFEPALADSYRRHMRRALVAFLELAEPPTNPFEVMMAKGFCLSCETGATRPGSHPGCVDEPVREGSVGLFQQRPYDWSGGSRSVPELTPERMDRLHQQIWDDVKRVTGARDDDSEDE